MKRSQIKNITIKGVLCLGLLAGLSTVVNSQCIPDTINCIDVEKPGQICPAILAEGMVGFDFLEHLTIIGPDSATIGQADIALVKVSLSNIENLPPGLSYTAETLDFYPNQAYCASIVGVPQEEGTFFLKISVIPYTLLFGVLVTLPTQVDSLSVYVNIQAANSVEPDLNTDFSLIQAYPNPFKSVTKIGFHSPDAQAAELLVFSMLGECMHREKLHAVSGPNYFNYMADDLGPGYYLYSIRRQSESLFGRLIKSR